MSTGSRHPVGNVPERQPGPIRVNRYQFELAWMGIQTFLKLPLCLTPEDLRAGSVDVAIGGVPWDGTATTRSGTHLGPQAIRSCDHIPSPPYERPHLHVRVDLSFGTGAATASVSYDKLAVLPSVSLDGSWTAGAATLALGLAVVQPHEAFTDLKCTGSFPTF